MRGISSPAAAPQAPAPAGASRSSAEAPKSEHPVSEEIARQLTPLLQMAGAEVRKREAAGRPLPAPETFVTLSGCQRPLAGVPTELSVGVQNGVVRCRIMLRPTRQETESITLRGLEERVGARALAEWFPAVWEKVKAGLPSSALGGYLGLPHPKPSPFQREATSTARASTLRGQDLYLRSRAQTTPESEARRGSDGQGPGRGSPDSPGPGLSG